ncbi:FAD/NAD(P)-binding oxidoreductase [Sinorhizobium medicae]|uniref:FAD/NAD(P)-binding oxidoreductase n=1 Tax=Sinorhizobium medicae TaxID=110321 RepID=A0ABX4TL93_9HYPH|nr:FAD/NAD(P)-binding oxidoreductase [Sinorhizobium medicae]PLT88308.1 FAD/NAD(P)-binding oxidoreductase [Sinorhizobium medicae]PLU02559.1 FAD/NAD(P)-binding oxidoreductase [Sinorhizobium medicae]PLU13254.1 FAD/NAD(P)-binding oxidoreductase [Sinorhizobium medicae]PLU19175.1 FAD/NAD(P)-binding oxidoreductase [Sinorhizobium medicae]PLU33591.1 FAD/NAD(P)-binding oxidoreductase [Sinorhizobium medicae]
MSEDAVDLVIIGSGPAGMAAACEAGSCGLSVVLLDEQTEIGGQIYRRVESAPQKLLGILGQDYAAGQLLASDFRNSGARYFGGATVWNVTTEGVVDYVANGRAGEITGKFVLLASGAMERPFPIEGWTLPGVMGAGAGQIMLKGSGALPSEPVVLAGCGPLLYLLAWQYLRAGAEIAAIVETTQRSAYFRALRQTVGALMGWRDLAKGLKLVSAIRRTGVPVYSGARDLAIEGTTHAEGLRFTVNGKAMHVAASLVLLHQGVVPNTQLSWSTGTDHRWDEEQLCWKPVTDETGRMGDTQLYVAGDSRGIVGANASAVQGRLAALAIAEQLGLKRSPPRITSLKADLRRLTNIRPFLDALYRPQDENRIPPDHVLVCRCEEVSAGQVRKYVELGCRGPNQTKAFGRCGMGPCQGRLCGLTVTEVIAEARGVEPSGVGYYRIRSPIKPILLGSFAD